METITRIIGVQVIQQTYFHLQFTLEQRAFEQHGSAYRFFFLPSRNKVLYHLQFIESSQEHRTTDKEGDCKGILRFLTSGNVSTLNHCCSRVNFISLIHPQRRLLGDWLYLHHVHRSVQFSQFSSVTQLLPTLCDPMDCSTPGLPVHHQLPEFTQTHVHWVSDANQPSHLLSSPSPAFNLSQHQGLFKWVSSSHQVAKVLEFQLRHQSFQWIFRTDFLLRLWT